jgi:hypothetical protein
MDPGVALDGLAHADPLHAGMGVEHAGQQSEGIMLDPSAAGQQGAVGSMTGEIDGGQAAGPPPPKRNRWGPPMVPPAGDGEDDGAGGEGGDRKRKRRSRWEADDACKAIVSAGDGKSIIAVFPREIQLSNGLKVSTSRREARKRGGKAFMRIAPGFKRSGGAICCACMRHAVAWTRRCSCCTLFTADRAADLGHGGGGPARPPGEAHAGRS